MAAGTDRGRITRQDLEDAFRGAVGEVETVAKSSIPQAVVAGAALFLVALALAYLAGRRRGRHRSAVVEIRRL
jgi:hypothetical protein